VKFVYVVSLLDSIDYGATGVDTIIQNVRFILSTVWNSCVLNRSLGWVQDIKDGPIDFVKSQLAARIVEAIESKEPRAQVKEVLFDVDPLNGRLIPTVKVVIQEDATIQSA
jgi:uncharacterized protein